MKNYETSLQEEIYLEGTDTLPSVTFLREGSMRIEGKIISDTIHAFFIPLHDWIKNLKCNKVIFDIDLDFINSNALIQLYNLLKTLNDNLTVQHICVFWHYEEGDDEQIDRGKIMEGKLKRIKFFYKSYTR